MGKIVGWLVPLALVASSALAWQNARENPDVARLARETACGPRSGCVVERAEPLRVERNPLRHRYHWDTSLGTAVVECRRAQVLMGRWGCRVDRERLGTPASEPGAYPTEVRRGQVD